MTSYCIWDNTEVSDPQKLEEYKERVAPVVEKFGGQFNVVEGVWPLTCPIIIAFPTMDIAKAWYGSEEYTELKTLRQSASSANAVFIDGLGI